MRVLSRFVGRYNVALACVIGAWVLTQVLHPVNERFPYLLFAGAVVAAALAGGFRPGLVTTLLSSVVLFGRHFVLHPEPGESVTTEFLPQLSLFVFVGFLASYLGEYCWKAVRAAEWMQTAIASAGEAVVFLDVEGQVTFVNSVAQDLTGWSAAAALEKPVESVFRIHDAETRDDLGNLFKKAVATRSVVRHEEPVVLVSRTGAERFVLATLTPILDRDEEVEGAILVFQDVTGMRQGDANLRQSEEKHRTLLENLPAPAMFVNTEGRCTYLNRMAQALCGVTFEEGMGEGWIRHVHAEDREPLAVAWRAAVVDNVDFEREVRLNPPLGGPKLVRLRSTPLSSSKGTPLGQLATLHDLAEIKRAEETLRQKETTFAKSLEEALRQKEATFAKSLEERMAELKESREALKQARETAKKQLDERAAELAKVQEALKQGQQEFEKRLKERAGEVTKVQETLKQAQEAAKKQIDERAAELARVQQALRAAEESARRLAEERSAELAKAQQSMGDVQDLVQQQLAERTAELQKQLAAAVEREKTAQARFEELLNHQRLEADRRFETESAKLANANAALQRDLQELLQAGTGEKSDLQRRLHETEQLWQESEERLRLLQDQLAAQQRSTEDLRQEAYYVRWRLGLSRAVAGTIKEGIVAVDPQGALVFLNRAAEELLGWHENDVAGKPLHAWLLASNGEKNGWTKGAHVHEQETFAHKNGTTLKVVCTESPLVVDEKVEGTVIVFQVATDRPVVRQIVRVEPAETPRRRAPRQAAVVAGRQEGAWIDFN